MSKNGRLVVVLGIVAGVCSAALIAWAVVGPVLERQRAEEMVDQAEALLSISLENRTDLDAVDCDRAEALLRRASEQEPNLGRARRLATLASGCSALRRGDLILAEGALRSAAQQLSGDPRPHRWLGALALDQGRPELAEDHLRRALELDNGYVPAQVALSDVLAELGREEEALERLESLELPPLGLIENRRGLLLEALGRPGDAAEAYRRAMELWPRRAEPRNNLAALERDRGNPDRAWQLQLEAVERSPDDPVILLNAGLLAITLGHDDRAEELLSHAAELDRESADPARALADHLLVRGHVERALEVLGPAVERFPRDAALRNSLGNALAAAGRAGEARRAYRTAIDTDASLAEPHNGLAALLMAEGDLEGAQQELERALALDPGNVLARQNLEVVRRRLAEVTVARASG